MNNNPHDYCDIVARKLYIVNLISFACRLGEHQGVNGSFFLLPCKHN